MLISVIIPSCNRKDLLAKCLDLISPYSQTIKESFEVIVTDDSKDLIIKWLIKEEYPWVTWVDGPKKGPAANRNNGAKIAKGKWLVFLDDDCEPDKDLLHAYLLSINESFSSQVFEGAILSSGKLTNPLYTAPINETGGYLWSCNFAINKESFFFFKWF